MTLIEWAARWGVSGQALVELATLPGYVPDPPRKVVQSEGGVQSLVRLEAGRKGVRLYRNNSGAGFVADPKKLCNVCLERVGRRPIRWGLGNDSPNVNAMLKSGDLFGWRRRLITPADVGTIIAQTVNRECKAPGWVPDPTDDHEQAQLRWHYMVLADGGDSAFVTGEGSL